MRRTAHKVFALIDAPHAHAIDDIVVEVGWISHAASEMFAVVTMADAIAALEQR